MNIFTTMAVRAVGTAEGVKKEWDTRGRKGEEESPGFRSDCIGPECGKEEEQMRKPGTDPIIIPHLDNLELMMTSDKGGRNIHFDKQALRDVLHKALLQLESDDVETKYLNSDTPADLQGKLGRTDHYISVSFKRPGIKGGAVQL